MLRIVLCLAEQLNTQVCQGMINTELSADQRAMWLAVGGGVMAGVFCIGMLVYCCCWREKPSVHRRPPGGSDRDPRYAAMAPEATPPLTPMQQN